MHKIEDPRFQIPQSGNEIGKIVNARGFAAYFARPTHPSLPQADEDRIPPALSLVEAFELF